MDVLEAKGMGLKTHHMDGFDEGCVKREFKIPDNKAVPMLVALGNPKQGAAVLPRAYRRTIEEFVSFYEYKT